MAEPSGEAQMGPAQQRFHERSYASKDPVIKERIDEAIERLQERQEAEDRAYQDDLPPQIPWKERVVLALTRHKQEKLDKARRETNRQRQLDHLYESIPGTIISNRYSRQLYTIARWMGDPEIMKMSTYNAHKKYCYDSGERDNPHVDYSYRKWGNARFVLREMEHQFKSNKPLIMMYDTSDTEPQMDAGTFVRTMRALGFVIDMGVPRALDVMAADLGGSVEAEQRLTTYNDPETNNAEHRGLIFLPYALDSNWLRGKDNELKGYVRITGDRTYADMDQVQFEQRVKQEGGQLRGERHALLKDGEIISRDLSGLCAAWDQDSLYAGLQCVKKGPDFKVSVDLSTTDMIDIGTTGHRDSASQLPEVI